MASRLKLQRELETMLGSEEVYFQPPESVRLHYPAIIYKKQAGSSFHADNYSYVFRTCYDVTIIDYDPDADWVKKVLDRFKYVYVQPEFTSQNLNHFHFRIYY